MLDLHRLNVLRTVAREGSFSAAARALDYTQPAISHHIHRLEAEVGTPLLVRTPTHVRLTEAGEALVRHAELASVQLAIAEDELAALTNLRTGRVRVAAFPSASATLVPWAARELQRAGGEISLSLTEAEPPEALELLHDGAADLIVGFDYTESPLPQTPGFELEPLLEDDVWMVLPAAATQTLQAIDTYAGSTWIAGCQRCRSHLLALAEDAGFEPRIAFATDDAVTVQALVAAGLGVALLPSLALAAATRDDIIYAPLAHPSHRRIVTVLPASPTHAPAVAAMLAALRTSAREFKARGFNI